MPYIKKEDRRVLKQSLDNLLSDANLHFTLDEMPGVCNYIITELLDYCMQPTNYRSMNDTVGILECCKLEFYRRVAAPYEDVKKQINGDVYSPMGVFVESSH